MLLTVFRLRPKMLSCSIDWSNSGTGLAYSRTFTIYDSWLNEFFASGHNRMNSLMIGHRDVIAAGRDKNEDKAKLIV